eukprot:1075430-Pelagomonas_calceolata.AAC.5
MATHQQCSVKAMRYYADIMSYELGSQWSIMDLTHQLCQAGLHTWMCMTALNFTMGNDKCLQYSHVYKPTSISHAVNS